jgi:hypothetical protein
MQGWSPQQHLTWLEERAFDEAYESKKRRMWLAYLLAVPLGCMGVHRIYLGSGSWSICF